MNKLVDGVLVPLTDKEISEREAASIKSPEQLMAEAKTSRQAEVDAIKVTTPSGKTFDGDETSQARMSRAITAMETTDTLPWVLADNTVATVTKAELLEALKLAGAEMAAIWVKPYSGV